LFALLPHPRGRDSAFATGLETNLGNTTALIQQLKPAAALILDFTSSRIMKK
jgi:hypothetical protein